MNPSSPCTICFQAKHSRTSFPISDAISSNLFDLIHCNVWGPYSHKSTCGLSYFPTLVDDHSRSTWVYLLAHKSNVSTHLEHFLRSSKPSLIEPLKVSKQTMVQTLKSFFLSRGIIHQTTVVHTPQQVNTVTF